MIFNVGSSIILVSLVTSASLLSGFAFGVISVLMDRQFRLRQASFEVVGIGGPCIVLFAGVGGASGLICDGWTGIGAVWELRVFRLGHVRFLSGLLPHLRSSG